ncbi:MAG: electron transfer flavoprotein, beta subunit [Zestosphaera tikiterensis]|uniref:Electron transfer flavoprotein, beta subunit n=1 Tax=Zestosphaera tikiterensis TaxID=1973259 RepID=A0A2R7Y6I2_9CREN|nr:MAG: electron transfer flavoprotein, beta subunit [Zestosphaera tikiterensis]
MTDNEFHIVVLIKPVPDMEKVRFDVEKGVVDRSSAPLEINPFDLNALEAAVQIKEKLGGEVTAVSMAPPAAESVLRDAIARGADRAVLLTDRRFAGADTLATSYALASAIRKLGRFNLIICGEKTVDGDTGQVGPEVAEMLGIPHIAYVTEIREVTKEKLLVVSELGAPYLMELKLPGLITVTKDVNKPRLPTLKDKLKARKAKVEVWSADDLADVADVSRFGFSGSPTQVVKVLVPPMKKRRSQIFKGEDAVDKLIEALEMEGLLR